ncbi:AraC family transcriptional regulator [Labilibacter sediminis]|nr:AraC family transcriptional regulator [Labilibacter sediminis]
MNLTPLNDFIVIHIFGSLTLLSFITFFNPLKTNKKGNLWFGLFLLFYSSFWMEEIIEYIKLPGINSLLVFVIHSVQIFTSVLFYFSVMFYAKPKFKLKKSHLIHLIVPIFYIILRVVKGLNTSNEQLRLNWALIVVILSVSVFYLALSFVKIRKHQRQILLFSSDTKGVNLNWLEYIVMQFVGVIIVVAIYNILNISSAPNILINVINLITVYLIAYNSLKQREIFPVTESRKEELAFINNDKEEQEKERKKIISDKELEQQKQKLNELMKNEKPFLDSELNLVKLAEMILLTPHQLSYVINEGYGENFFQHVNKYRVEEAKILLCDNENRTMLAVAFDSGFNSKTSFNTTFKKITEQTPSDFKRNIQ